MKQYWGAPAAFISCNKGYDFATTPAWLYQCFVDGTWILYPGSATMPWPDCTGKLLPILVYNNIALFPTDQVQSRRF